MELSISKAFRNGFSHAFSKNGLALMLMAMIFMSFSRVATSALFTKILGGGNLLATDSLMAQLVSLPIAALAVISGIALLLLGGFSVVAIRTLTHDVTHMIPIDFIERNILGSTINLMIGGLIFWILFVFGLILLIIPGLFIASVLLYFQFYVAVEDENFVDSLKKSVSLTSGNRFKNFGLVTLIFISILVFQTLVTIIIALALGFGALMSLGLDPLLSQIYKAVLYSVTMIFTIAIYADAYRQMKEAD